MLKIRYIGKDAIIVGEKTYYQNETFELTEAGFKLLKKTVNRRDLKVLSEFTEAEEDEGDTSEKTPAQQASDQGATVLADVSGKDATKATNTDDKQAKTPAQQASAQGATVLADVAGKDAGKAPKAK